MMAENMKHTPGPWTAEEGATRGAWIKGSNGGWVALACGDTDATAAANACVLAAAPDLLEALKTLLDSIEINDDPAVFKAQTAIDKAERQTAAGAINDVRADLAALAKAEQGGE